MKDIGLNSAIIYALTILYRWNADKVYWKDGAVVAIQSGQTRRDRSRRCDKAIQDKSACQNIGTRLRLPLVVHSCFLALLKQLASPCDVWQCKINGDGMTITFGY